MPRWRPASLGLCFTLACASTAPPRPDPPPLTPPRATLRAAPEGFELRLEHPQASQPGFSFLIQRGPQQQPQPCGPLIMLPDEIRPPRALAHLRGQTSAATPWLEPARGAPLPPPEAPLAFAAAGAVELTWMAPEGATMIRVERDGRVIAERPAEEGLYTDTPRPGRRVYRIRALTDHALSPPSPPTRVRVRRR